MMIPYGRQDVTKKDIENVKKVLESDFLTQGPVVPKFEKAVSDYVGSKYGVAANSATSALHIACLALGVSEGDMVWTSANTFVASSNCALYCGSKIDFIDINNSTLNICIDNLEEKLKKAEINNTLPKVVIVVHLAGRSAEMREISILSKKYDFKIIEDASHAIGGSYLGNKIGSCKYSDITVFSFHPVKIITSGEGGMALTNDRSLAESMLLFRSHGITRNEEQMSQQSHGQWFYEQKLLGFNYRMTDIHAALGLSQLERCDEYVSIRNQLASIYNYKLDRSFFNLPYETSDSYSSYHLYIIRLKLDRIKKTHKEVFNYMRDKGVLVNLHYIPVYFHAYYKKLGFKKGHCPNAEKYYSEAMSIPIFPALSGKDQLKVINFLSESVI